jgi:hypothetical protein
MKKYHQIIIQKGSVDDVSGAKQAIPLCGNDRDIRNDRASGKALESRGDLDAP